jgi:hypothetical protein
MVDGPCPDGREAASMIGLRYSMHGTRQREQNDRALSGRDAEVHRLLVDGEMHCDWSWFRTDGSLMRTRSCDRGRQVGTWRTHDRAGMVVQETRFAPKA